MRTLRTVLQLAIAVSFVAVLSAAPGQVPEFRMAAQIDHFDITCPPEFNRQAVLVGRQAENAYQRVSSSLQRDLSFRPLLVLFPTSADQTRAIDTRTIPGNREHLLATLDTPENRIEGQFIHELSHVFLFDALPPAQHRNVPVWILEGLAEHQRGEWNEGDRAALRNMVDRGALPKLSGTETLERARYSGTPRSTSLPRAREQTGCGALSTTCGSVLLSPLFYAASVCRRPISITSSTCI